MTVTIAIASNYLKFALIGLAIVAVILMIGGDR